MSVTKPPNISDFFGEEILTEKFENEGTVAREKNRFFYLHFWVEIILQVLLINRQLTAQISYPKCCAR
jgi:hypothetical protein